MFSENFLTGAELVEWIHRFDRRKRTYATVTELFLEHVLVPVIVLNPVSTGWAYWPQPEDRRMWLRLKRTSPVLSTAEQELVRRLAPAGHRFFVIADAAVCPAPRSGLPEVSLAVREAGLDAGSIVFGSSTVGRDIENAVNRYLRNDVPAAPEKDVCIRRWLNRCSLSEIERIFVSRCVLNGYRPEHSQGGPVDVDAIYLARKDQQLEFLEFKKKDAAYGTYCPEPEAPFHELLQTAANHNRTPKSAVKAFCKTLKWRKGPCFGLDSDSHAPNVAFCESHGIRYRYLVWDESPSTPMTDLLDENLQPAGTISLRHALVRTADFRGMSYSPPGESSDIGRAERPGLVRTQLMLPVGGLFRSHEFG